MSLMERLCYRVSCEWEKMGLNDVKLWKVPLLVPVSDNLCKVKQSFMNAHDVTGTVLSVLDLCCLFNPPVVENIFLIYRWENKDSKSSMTTWLIHL